MDSHLLSHSPSFPSSSLSLSSLSPIEFLYKYKSTVIRSGVRLRARPVRQRTFTQYSLVVGTGITVELMVRKLLWSNLGTWFILSFSIASSHSHHCLFIIAPSCLHCFINITFVHLFCACRSFPCLSIISVIVHHIPDCPASVSSWDHHTLPQLDSIYR